LGIAQRSQYIGDRSVRDAWGIEKA